MTKRKITKKTDGWKVVKSVKPKKGQKLIALLKDADEKGLGGTKMTFDYFTKPRFQYGNRTYAVEKVKFYDEKTGQIIFEHANAWGTGNEYSTSRDYKAISFDKEIKMKRAEKLDGTLFFLSKGKDHIWERFECTLYVPMRYLEALGYEIREKTTEYTYQTNYEKQMFSPMINIRIESKTTHHFDKRLADLQKLIKQAKSKEDLAQALKVTMDMHDVKVY